MAFNIGGHGIHSYSAALTAKRLASKFVAGELAQNAGQGGLAFDVDLVIEWSRAKAIILVQVFEVAELNRVRVMGLLELMARAERNPDATHNLTGVIVTVDKKHREGATCLPGDIEQLITIREGARAFVGREFHLPALIRAAKFGQMKPVDQMTPALILEDNGDDLESLIAGSRFREGLPLMPFRFADLISWQHLADQLGEPSAGGMNVCGTDLDAILLDGTRDGGGTLFELKPGGQLPNSRGQLTALEAVATNCRLELRAIDANGLRC